MIQYEYQVTSFDCPVSNMRIFDTLGAEGWEMCGVAQGANLTYYYWKRRLFGVEVEQDYYQPRQPGSERPFPKREPEVTLKEVEAWRGSRPMMDGLEKTRIPEDA